MHQCRLFTDNKDWIVRTNLFDVRRGDGDGGRDERADEQGERRGEELERDESSPEERRGDAGGGKACSNRSCGRRRPERQSPC